MAVLHLVTRATATESCLGSASSEDVILLIEDGVYAGVSSKVDREFRAIDVDVRARGIAKRLNPKVTIVSYTDFVRLAEIHNPIVTWR